ncbi:MAG: RnfABCDGE type electron transport complex subunit D, partial [Clostridia bacterium]
TGIILGLILPPEINLLIAAFGSVVAIIVIKQMFGGIGQNFANPACTARIVLLLSFSAKMSMWITPNTFITKASDALTSATPLVSKSATYLQLLTGETAGCIGETCVIAILLGFAYLLFRKVINPIITVSFLGSAALMSLFLGADVLYQLMSGGLLFGAVFMATDYSTSPINPWAKIVFGIGCGVITMLIRVFGALPEGVSYAILIMNIISPQLDNIFISKPFGVVKSKN